MLFLLGSVEVHKVDISNELASIGIFADVGIKYCGDVDFYIEILKVSVNSSEEKIKKIQKCYEDKDYEGYTIVVHSVKSSAANIGAVELSNLAKKLELAGKSADYTYIENNTEEFIYEYKKIVSGIRRILNMEIESDRVLGDKIVSFSEWKDMVNNVRYYIAELELELAEKIIDTMLYCRVNDETHTLLRKIKEQLRRFDVEGVKTNLDYLDIENDLS